MSVLRWPAKDPDEVLDYAIDWERRLDGDTISGAASWSIEPSGSLAKDTSAPGSGQSETDTTTTIWLKDGTAGQAYDVTCRITTAGGRTMEETARLLVQSSAS